MTLNELDTKNNNITLFRLIAAWLVLYTHSWALTGAKGLDQYSLPDRLFAAYMPFDMKLSGVAVAMFFLFSGFLITKSFDRGKSNIHYVTSRVLRIYPALWVNLLFCAFVIGPIFTQFNLEQILKGETVWSYIRTNAVMLKTHYRLMGSSEIFPANPNVFGINGSLWTLPAELRAYILVFLFGLLGAFKSLRIFSIAIIGLIVAFLYFDAKSLLVAHPSHFRLMLFFLIGSIFYGLKKYIRLDIRILFSLAIIAIMSKETDLYNLIASVAISYALFYISYHPKLRLPSIDRFGDFSYGLYLYAFPIQQSVVSVRPEIDPIMLVIISTILSMIAAVLSWFIVEKPSLGLKDKVASFFLNKLGKPEMTAEKSGGVEIKQSDAAW